MLLCALYDFVYLIVVRIDYLGSILCRHKGCTFLGDSGTFLESVAGMPMYSAHTEYTV